MVRKGNFIFREVYKFLVINFISMNKRFLYFLGMMLVLFFIVQVLLWWVSCFGFFYYVEKIGEYLQLQEIRVQCYFQNEDFFIDFYGGFSWNYCLIKFESFVLLEEMVEEEFVVYFFEGDFIIVWNYNSI